MRPSASLHRLPGPGDLYQPPADDPRAEHASQLAAQYRTDPSKCREAEQWVAGAFDGEHYAELTLALHRLHHAAPSTLAGSDLLATLYRLAAVEAGALDAQLQQMAEDAVQAAQDEAAEARSEAAAFSGALDLDVVDQAFGRIFGARA